MLEKAYHMREVLDYICNNKSEYNRYLIENWDDINNYIIFLRPFFDATLLLSKSKYPSIIYVVPTVDVLQKQMSQHNDTALNLDNCAKAMEEKSVEYLPHLYTDFAIFAIILDPRLKNDYFIEQGHEEYLIRFRQYFTIHYVNNAQQLDSFTLEADNGQPASDSSQPLSTSKKTVFSVIYKQKSTLTTQDEIEKYFSFPMETEDVDVLCWWFNQRNYLPLLTQMAYDVLPVPASSVPSEQAFSAAGNLITKKRNRLGHKTIRASMCLPSWLDVLK
jgi:hypothetical protein